MVKIKGFENYIISEKGEVFNSRTGRSLVHGINQKGYHQVQLSNKGYKCMASVHRLVFSHYIGEIKPPLMINHIDGNKDNNHFTNLELVTNQENLIKAVTNGQIKSGSDCKLSIQVSKIDPITKIILKNYGSIRLACKDTGIAESAISMVINKKRLSAGGFIWEKINKRIKDGKTR